MEENLKKTDEVGEGLLRERPSSAEIDKMRSFIAAAAWSLKDEKLLKMLYIRAKTITRL